MNARRLRKLLVRLAWSAFALASAGVVALVWDGLHDNIGDADVGLVLGNTVHPDGRPSDRLVARLTRAAELYNEGFFGLIIVSGALGREGHDEAIVMRRHLISQGIPAEHIITDSAGYTTYDSARNTEAFMRERGFERALVVTQYFHVPRARFALRRFGVERVFTAHAHHFEWRDLYSTPREILGILRYTFRAYEPAPGMPDKVQQVTRSHP